tara:strand:- start:202 stop:624 length:423 start_codon:yes stop_codon:yes gene_type:complete
MIDIYKCYLCIIIIIVFAIYFYIETKNQENFQTGDYLSSVDKNNEIMIKFCKKMKMLNKPNENNLIFKKFSKEFIVKKEKYIENLKKKIKELQEEMNNEDIDKYNIYKLRTHDQAQKQIQALELAKNNLLNKNKLKINIV